MKKICIVFISVFLLILSACSSDTLEIEIKDDIYIQQGAASLFVINVTDENGAVKDLKIDAVFSMISMDHGKATASFKDLGDGDYSTEIELPMEGEWEIVFNVEKDGKTIEKVLSYEVKEAEGVATINGDWITKDDIEFYRFINKLHIAINREKDKSKYEGKELKDAFAYWDEQEKIVGEQNQLLTQIIRLRAMALLGMEKGHKATSEEVNTEIENIRSQYEEFDVAKQLIDEYGADQFWEKELKQYELIVLSQKVQNDLIDKVKAENPNVNEQEILYLAQKEYEELLVSQVNSLEIKITGV